MTGTPEPISRAAEAVNEGVTGDEVMRQHSEAAGPRVDPVPGPLDEHGRPQPKSKSKAET